MGILGSIRAALAVPAPFSAGAPDGGRYGVGLESPWADNDILTRVTLGELWPGLLTDEVENLRPVPRSVAMTVPAVAAARHRIVGTLARLPIRAYTKLPTPDDPDGTLWAGDTSLLDQPDPAEPHVLTMTKTLDDQLFYGRSWWVVTRVNAAGFPVDIVHAPAADVTIDGDGWPQLDARLADWIKRTGRDVLPNPHPSVTGPWLIELIGPHDGLCMIGRVAIRSAIDLDRSAGNAARNPVPSIELHQTTDADMTDPEIDALIAQWERARRGTGVGYTNAAVDLRTHGVQPTQLLVDGRNQSAVEVARLAGIPAPSIDAGLPGSSITYANMTERLTDLINLGLQPYAAAFNGRLSMNDVLPNGVRTRHDYAELYPATTPAATAENERSTP